MRHRPIFFAMQKYNFFANKRTLIKYLRLFKIICSRTRVANGIM